MSTAICGGSRSVVHRRVYTTASTGRGPGRTASTEPERRCRSAVPWLPTLRQPTLVLAGDDDPIVPLINGRILTSRIPGARLHVLPGAGHLFLLEQPAYLAGVVAAFLAEQR